jgi:hypothetical protein
MKKPHIHPDVQPLYTRVYGICRPGVQTLYMGVYTEFCHFQKCKKGYLLNRDNPCATFFLTFINLLILL